MPKMQQQQMPLLADLIVARMVVRMVVLLVEQVDKAPKAARDNQEELAEPADLEDPADQAQHKMPRSHPARRQPREAILGVTLEVTLEAILEAIKASKLGRFVLKHRSARAIFATYDVLADLLLIQHGLFVFQHHSTTCFFRPEFCCHAFSPFVGHNRLFGDNVLSKYMPLVQFSLFCLVPIGPIVIGFRWERAFLLFLMFGYFVLCLRFFSVEPLLGDMYEYYYGGALAL
jgi:hypothetical protein